MTSKRLHLMLLAVVGLLLCGLLAGTYSVNKLLAKEAANLTALKAKSLALDQEQLSFKKAQKDIQTYSSLQKIARSVVPQDKDQAQAVREIVNIAAANNVRLAAINFPASTLGGTGVAAAGAAGSAGAGASSTGNAASAKSLSQLLPVKTIPGVYQLPITIEGDSNNPVRYDKFINFLSDLEHNRRTAQVSTISLQPDTKNSGYVTFTLNLSEYIKP